MSDLIELFVAIGSSNHDAALTLMEATPSLATDALSRTEEFFLTACLAQLYQGDTALHVAAFSYDGDMARQLLTRGANARARNRRGAEPLHAAVNGVPREANWNPTRQREVIGVLVTAGADPNATAAGGVTPLHRAVRNRCSAAVETLLDAGADPRLANNSGSTAWDLAHQTTGRGGTGSGAAKVEQQAIIEMLEKHRS